MNNILKTIILLVTITLLNACSNIDIARFKALGETSFDKNTWLVSNEQQRGEMFFDFLQSNSPITNKKAKFVFDSLGPSTGYYLYDHFPAYYIGPKPANNNAKAYLVAFEVDHDSGEIKDIYVHPNL